MKKHTEIIATDIGNTSILFGHMLDGKIKKTFRLGTGEVRLKAIKALNREFPIKRIQAVVIASVVPAAGKFLRREIPKKLGVKTFLLGKDLSVPIKNKYKNPKQVGIDRLTSSLAAFHQYRRPAVIIDFGTAITFDVVSKKGEYLGGAIAPGVEISIEALFQKTALLPRIRLKHPKSIFGRDTEESIRAGCSFGIGGLCDNIVNEIGRKGHFKPLVIATGGHAKFMSKYCRRIDRIDPDLILKGILIAYKSSKKSG